MNNQEVNRESPLRQAPSIASRLSVCLLIMALIIFVYTVLKSAPLVFTPEDLGLVNRIPALYYAGFVCALTAFCLSIPKKTPQIISLGVLSLYFFGPGSFLIGLPRHSDAYIVAGELRNYVLLTGHVVPFSPERHIVTYHAWPAYHFFASALVHTTALPLTSLMKITPLFLYGAVATSLVVLQARWHGESGTHHWRWEFLALILLSMFLPHDHMGPVFMALVLIITLFLTVTQFSRSYIFLTIVIMFALVITHGIMSVSFLLSLGPYLIIKRHGSLASLGIVISWLWISSIAFVLELGVRGIYSVLSDPLGFFNFFIRTPSPQAGLSPWFSIVQYAQLTMGLIWAIILVIGTLVIMSRWREFPTDKQGIFIAIWVLAILTLTQLLTEKTFALDAPIRAYFILVPLAGTLYLATLRPHRLLILTLCVLILPVSWIARYGHENFMTPRNELIQSGYWVSDHGISVLLLRTTNELSATFISYSLPGVYQPGVRARIVFSHRALVSGIANYSFPLPDEAPVLIDKSRLEVVCKYDQDFQPDDFLDELEQARSKVYTSGEVSLFLGKAVQ